MNYQNDTTYQESFTRIDKALDDMFDKLKSDASTYAQESKEKKDERTAQLKSDREGIQAKYHRLLAYLGDKFNTNQESQLRHKMQELKHTAKKYGYELKSDLYEE